MKTSHTNIFHLDFCPSLLPTGQQASFLESEFQGMNVVLGSAEGFVTVFFFLKHSWEHRCCGLASENRLLSTAPSAPESKKWCAKLPPVNSSGCKIIVIAEEIQPKKKEKKAFPSLIFSSQKTRWMNHYNSSYDRGPDNRLSPKSSPVEPRWETVQGFTSLPSHMCLKEQGCTNRASHSCDFYHSSCLLCVVQAVTAHPGGVLATRWWSVATFFFSSSCSSLQPASKCLGQSNCCDDSPFWRLCYYFYFTNKESKHIEIKVKQSINFGCWMWGRQCRIFRTLMKTWIPLMPFFVFFQPPASFIALFQLLPVGHSDYDFKIQTLLLECFDHWLKGSSWTVQ